MDEGTKRKSIVFINDVPYEVDVGPFNVKEAFGDDVVLVDSSGQTVVTDEWGVTLQSLDHGALYHLVHSFADDHGGTIDMVHFMPSFHIVNLQTFCRMKFMISNHKLLLKAQV